MCEAYYVGPETRHDGPFVDAACTAGRAQPRMGSRLAAAPYEIVCDYRAARPHCLGAFSELDFISRLFYTNRTTRPSVERRGCCVGRAEPCAPWARPSCVDLVKGDLINV